MKILTILYDSIYHPQGGVGVSVKHTTSELVKYGHKITLLCYNYNTKKFLDVQQNGYRVLDCETTNLNFMHKNGYYFLTLYDQLIKVLLTYLKNEKFDLIVLEDSLLWPIAKYASILFNAPISVFCRLSFGLLNRSIPQSLQMFQVRQEAESYQQANEIITSSNVYADSLKNYFNLTRDIKVVLNGVDFKALQKYTKYYNFDLKKSRKQTVGFVGRLVPTKGIYFIIEAIKKCPDKFFVILSNVNPQIEATSSLAKKLNKLKKTHSNFIWYKDIPSNSKMKWEIMALCDVAIIPSLHEPFGLVALEWAALKIPRIIFTVDGLTEFNSNDDAIMIAPKIDYLLYALKTFMYNQKLVDNAHKKAKQMSWNLTAKKINKIYTNIIKQLKN